MQRTGTGRHHLFHIQLVYTIPLIHRNITDLLSIIHRRNAGVSVYVVPAIVQGQEGIASICQSLEVLYHVAAMDNG